MAGNFWRSSHYLEWLLDKQYVLKNRESDIKELGGEDEYQKLMIFFTGVICSFGEKLGVRQQVIAAAVTYFKRFYAMFSLKSVDPWLLGQTSLFLSSKIEEFGLISHKTIIHTCNTVIKQKYLQYFPREYPYKIHDVLDCEFILVEVMDCSLIIFHPYRSLEVFCENLSTHLNLPSDNSILQNAWAYVNDSYRTDLMLYFPPYMISLGCLLLSSIIEKKNEDAIQTWFAELSIDYNKMMEVVKIMMGLYCLWKNFNEETETLLLLAKMPKPKVNQQHSLQQHQNMNSHSNVMKASVIGHQRNK